MYCILAKDSLEEDEEALVVEATAGKLQEGLKNYWISDFHRGHVGTPYV